MARPVASQITQNSSKTSSVSLSGAATGSFSVGDWVIGVLASDPAAGTVTFAKASGTATIGSFTYHTHVNGSGTSGVAVTVGIARVSIAGTLNLTASFSSCVAKVIRIWKLTGADASPIVGYSEGFNYINIPSSDSDGSKFLIMDFFGVEYTTGNTVDWNGEVQWNGTSPPTSATLASDSTTYGTTGSGAASNISTAIRTSSVDFVSVDNDAAVNDILVNGSNRTDAVVTLILRNPRVAPGAVNDVSVVENGSGQLKVTWTDETVSDPIATYNVYRDDSSPPTTTRVTGITRGTQQWADSGLNNGTTYYYVVRATNSAGFTNSSVASGAPQGGTEFEGWGVPI